MALCNWLWLVWLWVFDIWLWVFDIWLRVFDSGFWFAPKHIRRRGGGQAPCSPVKGFRPAPPRRSGGRPKPAWVVEAVLRLYAEGGKSYRQVMNEFNRLHARQGMTVCVNTVYAWVQKYCSDMEAVRPGDPQPFSRLRAGQLALVSGWDWQGGCARNDSFHPGDD